MILRIKYIIFQNIEIRFSMQRSSSSNIDKFDERNDWFENVTIKIFNRRFFNNIKIRNDFRNFDFEIYNLVDDRWFDKMFLKTFSFFQRKQFSMFFLQIFLNHWFWIFENQIEVDSTIVFYEKIEKDFSFDWRVKWAVFSTFLFIYLLRVFTIIKNITTSKNMISNLCKNSYVCLITFIVMKMTMCEYSFCHLLLMKNLKKNFIFFRFVVIKNFAYHRRCSNTFSIVDSTINFVILTLIQNSFWSNRVQLFCSRLMKNLSSRKENQTIKKRWNQKCMYDLWNSQ